jgi:pimeloyl-ACP methyl ester carboxylesterase
MKLKVAGGELAFDVRGDGPYLLFLHAFPLGLTMWDAQAEAPARRRTRSRRSSSETTHRERPGLVARVREVVMRNPPRGIADALAGLAARADSGPTLRLIRVPTLVLRGDEDDPPRHLELVQRGVQRTVADLQDLAGDLLQALADGPAVERLEGENLQDQEVEGALHEIRGAAHLLISVSEWSIPRLS